MSVDLFFQVFDLFFGAKILNFGEFFPIFLKFYTNSFKVIQLKHLSTIVSKMKPILCSKLLKCFNNSHINFSNLKKLVSLIDDEHLHGIVSDFESSKMVSQELVSDFSVFLCCKSYWNFFIGSINFDLSAFPALFTRPLINNFELFKSHSNFLNHKTVEPNWPLSNVVVQFNTGSKQVIFRCFLIQGLILSLFKTLDDSLGLDPLLSHDGSNFKSDLLTKHLNLLTEANVLILDGDSVRINPDLDQVSDLYDPQMASQTLVKEENPLTSLDHSVFGPVQKVEAFLVRLLKKNKRLSFSAIRKQTFNFGFNVSDSFISDCLHNLAERELIVKEKNRKSMFAYSA
ncbi:hypothetical protein P9112_011256 [Eukaryota sp. TZLM1-RC]